jgi:hypothetical protein
MPIELNRRVLSAVAATTLLLTLLPSAASADSLWLDSPNPSNWNNAGMPLPPAPPPTGDFDPRVIARNRYAESNEDLAVTAQGWQLYTAYQAGWSMKLVYGTSNYDGMGRPLGYQVFVFVDGVFAGTLSPTPMDSRSDGSLSQAFLNGDQLNARFVRYTPNDPLCCPSSTTLVSYRVSNDGASPLVTPISTTSLPVGP